MEEVRTAMGYPHPRPATCPCHPPARSCALAHHRGRLTAVLRYTFKSISDSRQGNFNAATFSVERSCNFLCFIELPLCGADSTPTSCVAPLSLFGSLGLIFTINGELSARGVASIIENDELLSSQLLVLREYPARSDCIQVRKSGNPSSSHKNAS